VNNQLEGEKKVEFKLVGVEMLRQAIAAVEREQMEYNTAAAEVESAKALVDELSSSYAKAVEAQTVAERGFALSGKVPDDGPSREEELVQSWARKVRIARHRHSCAEEALASSARSLAEVQASGKASWIAFVLENHAEMEKAFFAASLELRRIIAEWKTLTGLVPAYGTGIGRKRLETPRVTIDRPDPDYPTFSVMVPPHCEPNIPQWWGKYRGEFSEEFTALFNEVKAAGALD
jgi:hypothetical protein